MTELNLDNEIIKTRQELNEIKSYFLIGAVPLTTGITHPSSGDLKYMSAKQDRFILLDKRLKNLLCKKAQTRIIQKNPT